ncbi:MAG: hypothetical protein ACREJ3_07960, partial [Polyangiaceae bacterium]
MREARLRGWSVRDPEGWVLAAFAVAILLGSTWGLPGGDSWAADSISPRSCGLGAITETYRPGHFHTYPPLQMAWLTVLSLPWIALAAARVGCSADALASELIKPLYMTGIEGAARALTATMALAIVWNTMRLWTRFGSRRVGLLAGLVVACNATLVYYAHTGNLEVPYLFWTTWAFVELDRVLSGEARERPLLLLVVAAALTKDQAVAAFVLPVPIAIAYVLSGGKGARGTPTEASLRVRCVALARAGAVAALLYSIVSGALVNPAGFRRRLAFLFGPASATWAGYAHGLHGTLAMARDALAAIPHFGSWGMALASVMGIALILASTRSVTRVRQLMPLAGAVSFTVFFTVMARRTEDRFLL